MTGIETFSLSGGDQLVHPLAWNFHDQPAPDQHHENLVVNLQCVGRMRLDEAVAALRRRPPPAPNGKPCVAAGWAGWG